MGGTFTDIAALERESRLVLTKVPTTPKDLLEGIVTAVRRVLALTGGPASAVMRGGQPLIAGEGLIGTCAVRMPMGNDVNTIGADGGRIAWIDGARVSTWPR